MPTEAIELGNYEEKSRMGLDLGNVLQERKD